MPDNSSLRIADRVMFGAAYYPEYLAVDRVAEDIALMAEAGFTLIRVGESVWSTWEPRDGEFELDWLAPVLDAAWERGISVILGTPTYAVPPWLMAKHPEIASESSTGVRVPWGARQETDASHPIFRQYAERIIRAIIPRYAEHPAVVGYQVDNEPGHQVSHNAHVFAAFKTWLIERFGSVESINREWNLAHWAHRMTHIDELWVPDGNHVPQYDLAWRRFHAERTTEYIDWQCAIVREYARADQFVTTCIDPMRSAVHDGDLAGVLDVVATNQYLASQSELADDVVGDYTFPPSGSWAPFYVADRGFGMRQERFLITETNASSIGFPWFNFPSFDGQWRQVGWAMIARGARSIAYWHWHTMHASWETYWGGVLPHSFVPGRVYEQIAELGREITAAGAAIEGLVPDAQVGVVFSMPSRWAFEYHPPYAAASSDPRKQGEPDRAAYERLVYRLYGGLSRAGLQARIWHAEQIIEQDAAEVARALPVLVVAGLVVSDDATTAWFNAYVAAGGHLVLGIRTGTADQDARIRSDVQPAGYADAAGVHYDEFSNLLGELEVHGTIAGRAQLLAEGLIPDAATVLGRIDHPHFGRWAAATTREQGAGRVTYLGVFPDLELATNLGRWIAVALSTPQWRAKHGTVQVHSATNGAGERVWFVHNFSGGPASVQPPVELEDLLTPGHPRVLTSDVLELAAWDVRVFRQSAQ